MCLAAVMWFEGVVVEYMNYRALFALFVDLLGVLIGFSNLEVVCLLLYWIQ